ncbi:hypothetical protein HMI56_003066, partial [Coelomomyces lativittatus]
MTQPESLLSPTFSSSLNSSSIPLTPSQQKLSPPITDSSHPTLRSSLSLTLQSNSESNTSLFPNPTSSASTLPNHAASGYYATSLSPLGTTDHCSSFTVTLPTALPGNEGSFSLSPSGRDVVLASQEGLILLDLFHPLNDTEQLHYTLPPIHWNNQISCQSKVQWNPHLLKQHCIASTKWNQIYIWHLQSSSQTSSSTTPSLIMNPSPPPSMIPSSSTALPTITSSMSSNPYFSPIPGSTTPFSTPVTSPPSSPLPKTDSPNFFSSSSTYFLSKLGMGSLVEHVLHGHTRSVTDIDWSPFQPDLLASCSLDSTVFLWDLRKPKKNVNSFSVWTDGINVVRWNPNNIWLFATAHNNQVWIWDIR